MKQRTGSIPPRRDTDQIEAPASPPALIMSLGGDDVLEVKCKDNKVFRTRLAAGDLCVTTPSAFEHAVVHEDTTSDLLNKKAVFVVLHSHMFNKTPPTAPQPNELFHLVCETIAERLCAETFKLPSLRDVIAAMPKT